MEKKPPAASSSDVKSETSSTSCYEATVDQEKNDCSMNYRKKGNDLYGKYVTLRSPSERVKTLQAAINSYYRAIATGVSTEDIVSATKNYGLASWRIATEKRQMREDCKLVLHHFKEGLQHLDRAMVMGKEVKCSHWADDMVAKLVNVANDLKDYLEADFIQGGARTADILVNISRDLVTEAVQLNLYHFAVDIYVHESIRSREGGRIVPGIKMLKEAHFPLEEMKRLTVKLHAEKCFMDVQVLESDVIMGLSTLESMLAYKQAEDLLKRATLDYEILALGLVWNVVDLLKHAALCTRELEVEQEAIILSRLGYIYAKVLKMESRAREYLTMAFYLASSLHPKNFEQEAWYQEAKEVLSGLQIEKQKEEDQKNMEEKKAILEELKAEMKALKKASTQGPLTLLELVYKSYAPKDSNCALAPNFKDETRKALQTAIIHYHPDRIDDGEHGKKWKILCEEVTKCLTEHYNSYKGL